MPRRVLITGGAGFVGSHLADHLLAEGYEVRALDNLSPQVHGEGGQRPAYLSQHVDLHVGDVRDRADVDRALQGVHAVFHLAAAVGVGQSMYEIERYTSVNNVGTAVLLEALASRPIERLVVASSMSLYGEGLYRNAAGERVAGRERTQSQLADRDWEIRDAAGERLTPVPTPEDKTPALPSVYALSKFDQEKLCLTVGRAYGIPSVALRFFNIYGPRQALGNPYTGVLAIFAARLLHDRPPLINEDGHQRRDFVSVHDVARACLTALTHDKAPGEVFNVGSGASASVREIAERMSRALGKEDVLPEITGKYRVGDIRHCFADVAHAARVLGWQPTVSLEQGLTELAAWLDGQQADDRVEHARRELEQRGLSR